MRGGFWFCASVCVVVGAGVVNRGWDWQIKGFLVRLRERENEPLPLLCFPGADFRPCLLAMF